MDNRENQTSPPSKEQNFWIETGKTIGLSLILSFGIRTFAAQAYNVSSGSMKPTLEVNDKFFVNKLSYRFREPQRGDIVVFSPTEQLKKEQFYDTFVKRVIGLPGETVELKDAKVYINNKLIKEQNYLSNEPPTLADGCTAGPQPPYLSKPVTIPVNSYLVLGDNRINSYDGRCWGLVPRKNIIGHAVARVWPLNHIGTLDKHK
jgi:signal peptidase I